MCEQSETLNIPKEAENKVFSFLENLLEIFNREHDVDNPIPIAEQIQTAMHFLTTARFDGESGQQCLINLINCLLEVAPQFIQFPEDETAHATGQFFSLGQSSLGTGFPSVLGVIDCTHIRLQPPEESPEEYLNDHNEHSINVQVVCGPDMEIYNIVAAFPGSYSNLCIWQTCNLRQMLNTCSQNCWLIGDKDYPQESWLMTPISSPQTPEEELYNKVHTCTWKPIADCIESLKKRFQCLESVLNYKPNIACAVITACCVLHNIYLKFGESSRRSEDCKIDNLEVCSFAPTHDSDGIATRELLIRERFSNN